MSYLLILNCFSVNSFALDFLKKGSSWVIQSDSCNEVLAFVSNSNVWSKELSERQERSLVCSKVNDSLYELNTAKFLPAKIQEVLSLGVASKNGHNCWNFSLYAHGFTNSLRYSGENEFSHVVNDTGVCKKIAQSSVPLAGDIIALRVENSGESTELHTYVYLDKDIMIHKRGSLAGYPYELARASEIDFKYKNGLENSCPKCSFRKDIYRCDSSKKTDLLNATKTIRGDLFEVECLHGKLSNPESEVHKQFKEKSTSLERLVSSSLEKSFNEYMNNNDKSEEKRITNDINSWLLIKSQLNSMQSHY